MEDKEFLQWIYNRMCLHHNENEMTDYMNKFRCILKGMNDEKYEKCSPNIILDTVYDRSFPHNRTIPK